MTKPVSAYLEQQIQAADPVTLIGLYYQSAISAIKEARRHLAAGDIVERSRSISLAHALTAELYRSLDFKGSARKLSLELGRLYDYAMSRLIAGNSEQKDKPLSEALAVLTTLADAWKSVPRPTMRTPVPAPVHETPSWNPAMMDVPESQYSWTL